MSRKILVIVEGGADEPRIIGKENCGPGLLPFMGVSDYEIVSLGNPIYELYDKVKRGECDDIVAYLRARGKLTLPDPDFDDRKIALAEDFNGNKYKKMVKKETCLSYKRMPRDEIRYMIVQNYNKAKLLDGSEETIINYREILERQIDEKNGGGEIFVLGTLPLMIIDYNVELTLSMYDLKFVSPTKLWLK